MNKLSVNFHLTTPMQVPSLDAAKYSPSAPSSPLPQLPCTPRHAPASLPPVATRAVSIDRALSLLARIHVSLRDAHTMEAMRQCFRRIPPEDRVEVIDATMMLWPKSTSAFELRALLAAVAQGRRGARLDTARATAQLCVQGRTIEAMNIFTALGVVACSELAAIVQLTRQLRSGLSTPSDTSALVTSLAQIPAAAREQAVRCLQSTAPNMLSAFTLAQLLSTLSSIPVCEHVTFATALRTLRPYQWGHETVDQARALARIPAALRSDTVDAARLARAQNVEGVTLTLLATLEPQRRRDIAQAFAAVLPGDSGMAQELLVRALMTIRPRDLPHVSCLAGHIGHPNTHERSAGVLALSWLAASEREEFVLLLQQMTDGIDTAEQRAAVTKALSELPREKRFRVGSAFRAVGVLHETVLVRLAALNEVLRRSVANAAAALVKGQANAPDTVALIEALSRMPAAVRQGIVQARQRAAANEADARLGAVAGRTAAWRVLADRLVGCADLDDAIMAVPLGLFLPYKQYIEARVRVLYSDTLAALERKAFQPKNSTHVFVAYLNFLQAPHAFKTCREPDRRGRPVAFDAFADVLRRKLTRDCLLNEHIDVAECWWLAYETACMYRNVIVPAQERARALGLPLRIVANVTYGGTAVTGLPIRALQRNGVEFIFTKMGSTDAHGDEHCLNPRLLSDEQLVDLVQRPGLYLVVDGSTQKYPDGMRGYRNLLLLANQAARSADPTSLFQAGLDRRAFLANETHDELRARLRQLADAATSPEQYGLYFTSSTPDAIESDFDDAPGPFSFDEVYGPAMVMVQPSVSDEQVTGRPRDTHGFAATLLARPEVVGRVHEEVAFDDKPEQNPVLYAGRRGFKAKPTLHPHTRVGVKVMLDGAPPLMTGALFRF